MRVQSWRRERPHGFASASFRRRLSSEDEGSALVIVLGAMLILSMLALTALTYVTANQKFARFDQDYTAAMAAAQSGVDDFISRMNRDDTYGYKPDCTNDAWRGPMPVTPPNPCGYTSATSAGWLPVVPGSTDTRAGWFHYSVDSSKRSLGTYSLIVTGRVNKTTRTLDVTVGKGGSTDYVYYTDYESGDPANVQLYPPTSAYDDSCGTNDIAKARYWHSVTGVVGNRQGKGCGEITFTTGDVLVGEVFTNDTILSGPSPSGAAKPSFMSQVWTADTKCDNATSAPATWEPNCLRAGSTANFNGKRPKYSDPNYLLDSSAGFVSQPGCHYFGATRVVFNKPATATDVGTMTVWNKKSVNNSLAPVAVPVPGGVTPSCGSLDDLDKAVGATVPVPNEMVIYVGTSTATARQCYSGELGGPSSHTLPVGTFTSTTPAAPATSGATYTADYTMLEPEKYCNQGNLYAEGVVRGRVTLAAAQSVVVTGDLVLAGGSSVTNAIDMIGLVATNSVEIVHPRIGDVGAVKRCTAYYPPPTSPPWLTTCKTSSSTLFDWAPVSTFYSAAANNAASDVSGWPTRYKDPTTNSFVPTTGVQIVGAIQTLQHSFFVQKYGYGGSKGDLVVTGSIAQRWRGAVGVNGGANGYLKKYSYDDRLANIQPPYFPSWANAKWTLRYSGEVNTPTALKS